MNKFNDNFVQLSGSIPDVCNHGVGIVDGMCPYMIHDDDFCLQCLKDIRTAITKEIRLLKKELKQ